MKVCLVVQPDLRGRADDALLVAAFADPDRHRRAPVAAAGELPVDVVLEPVAHPAGPDVVGHPVGGVVVGEQLLLTFGRADVPGIEGVVDERGAAAPAEGIGVEDRLRLVEKPAVLQVVDDHGVGFLHVQSRELLDVGQELSIEADGVLERDALFLT